MFKGVILRLATFNAVVIALILLASGVATYVAVSRSLTGDQKDTLLLALDSVSVHALEDLFHEDIQWPHGTGAPQSLEDDDESEPRNALGVTDAFVFATNRAILYPNSSSGLRFNDITDPDVLEAALEGSSGFGYVDQPGDDDDARVYIMPVRGEFRIVGALQVSISDHGRQEALSSLRKTLLFVAIAGALAAVTGGWLLSVRGLRPVRQAFERQRTFIADASHQLKTPVAIVRADAEALERAGVALESEDAQILKDLVASSAFLSDLVNQLLAVARMEGDRIQSPYQSVDLRHLVRETIRATARLAEMRGVTIVDASASQEPLTILGSPAQLSLVLMALVENAIKYNRPEGTVTVSLERSGDNAALTVADTGVGIAERDIERVWERFYRSEDARASSDDGAGLGLAIIRDVIRQHRGEISLTSKPGAGTTVTVTLRAATS